MVDPAILCDQHLLGEHGEIHKHRHNFVKHHSITNRVFPIAQIEPSAMEWRHNQLAEEMTKRGMNHKSPYELPDLSYLPEDQRNAKVHPLVALRDLIERCDKCRERFEYIFPMDEEIEIEWEEHEI